MPAAKLLEIACFNIESAVIAEKADADRIELCENYSEGGITPSNALIVEVRKKTSIPLHVIIRPRGGDFNYSAYEINEMKNAIVFCKSQNINGVVFGVLNHDNGIDVQLCRELIQLAKPMSITFHRAIDSCKNITTAIEALTELGVDRVLMSGGLGNALNNIETLMQLQNKYGSHIVIMPGGGLRSSNIAQVMQSGCGEYHSAAITGSDVMADPGEIKELKHFLAVTA